MKLFMRLLLPATLVFLLAACGNDDNGNGDPGGLFPADDNSNGVEAPVDDDATANGEEANGPDDNGAVQPPTGSGSGTMTVAGVTYEFEVRHCGFSPAETGNEDVPFSLRGQGVTPDGEPFEVDAVTVELNDDTESQTLSLWIGESFPYDVIYESGRMQMNGMVTGTSETAVAEMGMDWPMLEIDGNQVRAEGGFLEITDVMGAHDEELVGWGTFEATCP
jgi:hypothetical protein